MSARGMACTCISLAAGRHVWGTGCEVSPQRQDPLLRVTSATMCNFQLMGHRQLLPTASQKSSCVCVILLLLPVLRKLMWGICTGRSPAPNQLPWAQCWETQRTGRCGAGFLLPVRPCRVGESRGLMGLKCVCSLTGVGVQWAELGLGSSGQERGRLRAGPAPALSWLHSGSSR